MSIIIKLAETPAERNACLRLRHKVFVEADARFEPRPDRCLIDRFDCCGTSVLMVALSGDDVVGTARLNRDDETIGFPADDYFDFRPMLPAGAITASLSQLAVDPENRGNLKILNGMMMLTYYWAHRNGITHCVAPFNPALKRLMARIGFKSIGDVTQSSHNNLAIQPMMICSDDIRGSFIDFVARQKIVGFMEPYFREYFDAGEVILEQGAPGDCAYFIVNGEAKVTVSNVNGSREDKVVSSLEKGDLFGEMSLLLNVPRSANVIASTDLEVMILSRRQFLECIENDSENALFTLELLASRLAKATSLIGS